MVFIFVVNLPSTLKHAFAPLGPHLSSNISRSLRVYSFDLI